MQLERNHSTEASSEAAFGFYDEKSGVLIIDPYTSCCSRFIVDPMQEYGLNAGDLEWLSMMNAVYDCRHEEILARHGVYIEDMGKEYGNGWHGQYRWMGPNGLFQDDEPSFSHTDAVRRAWAYYLDQTHLFRNAEPVYKGELTMSRFREIAFFNNQSDIELGEAIALLLRSGFDRMAAQVTAELDRRMNRS